MFRTIALVVTCLLMVISMADGAEKGNEDAKRPWVDIKKGVKPVKPNIPPEYDSLVKAFDNYWNAVKDKKHDVAYSLESSEYRKGISLEKYKAEKMLKPGTQEVDMVNVRALEVKKINEKEVVVEGIIVYKAGFAQSVRSVRDKWVNEKEGWKHVPSQKGVITPSDNSTKVKK